ncbi:MAG: hypothetical protein ACE5K3_03320 [bacterium]
MKTTASGKRLSHLSIIKLLSEENEFFYLKWVLIGLLIRLTFMPFTFHGDIRAMNWVAHFLTYHGSLRREMMEYPPLAYYAMSFFQFLYRSFMPLYANTQEPAVDWVHGPHVFRYLFLFKSYYLIFDFGTAFLLPCVIQDKNRGLSAFKFWMLNPVVIYSSYVIGQFDILPTFFVALSLYYVWKSKLATSLLWLGIGASFKNFAFMYVIPALILLGRNKMEKLKLLLLVSVPYLFLLYPYLGGDTAGVPLLTGGKGRYMLLAGLDLAPDDRIYILIMGYAIILVLTYVYSQGYVRSSREVFDWLWRVELIVSLWWFAIITFHPQWFVWIMPLLTLFILENKRLITLYWLLVICFFVYTFRWGRGLFGRLFMPIDPVFLAKSRAQPSSLLRFIHIMAR